MQTSPAVKLLKGLWLAGVVVLFAAVVAEWFRGRNAQTFAEASRLNEQLGLTASLMSIWGAIGFFSDRHLRNSQIKKG